MLILLYRSKILVKIMFIVVGILFHLQAVATSWSNGGVYFSAITFTNLSTGAVTPGISWLGDQLIDGILDADADNFISHHNDSVNISDYRSDYVRAQAGGTVARSDVITGDSFYSQITSSGMTTSGYYQSIAYMIGIFSLTPQSQVTFAGKVSASAGAASISSDYSKGYSSISMSDLFAAPIDAVTCNVKNNKSCSKPFSFTISNDSQYMKEIGFEINTSVEGFSSPVPEPSTAALMTAGLMLLFGTSTLFKKTSYK